MAYYLIIFGVGMPIFIELKAVGFFIGSLIAGLFVLFALINMQRKYFMLEVKNKNLEMKNKNLEMNNSMLN